MKRAPIILALIVLVLMGITALGLNHVRSGHTLGEPGVKTRPRSDSKNLEILLPEIVAGYSSEISTQSETELLKLPADTSFRTRVYHAPDDFWSEVTVVMMGSDRSSIHKPQICMTGQGWTINDSASRQEDVPMTKPYPYTLRVNKLVASKELTQDGRQVPVRGVFVYWFVDADHLTASANQWMLWWMPRDLLTRGVLERWSYISYFTACPPGGEDAAFKRLKEFIVQSVPEYQLVPSAQNNLAQATQ
jgi:hypothetical protein